MTEDDRDQLSRKGVQGFSGVRRPSVAVATTIARSRSPSPARAPVLLSRELLGIFVVALLLRGLGVDLPSASGPQAMSPSSLVLVCTSPFTPMFRLLAGLALPPSRGKVSQQVTSL